MANEQKNCWEYMLCGREPGGNRVDELGICPVPLAEAFDNINNGVNGGRYCWGISGSMCGGKIQGSFTSKFGNCAICPFYQEVKAQERNNFIPLSRLSIIHNNLDR